MPSDQQGVNVPEVPFEFSRPLDPRGDDRIWVERPRTWERILVHLRRNEWIAVLGPKGTGRTSALRWIREQCGEEGLAATPFLLNLRVLQGRDAAQSIRELMVEFKSVADGTPGSLPPDWNQVKAFIDGTVSSVVSPAELEQFVVALARRCNGRLLVMLDDADRASGEARGAIFGAFRAVHESMTEPNVWIELVVCGVEAGPWLGAPEIFGSPLDNVLHRVHLGSFDETQIRLLMSSAFEGQEAPLEIERAAVVAVRTLTKGVPRDVQRLLHEVYLYAISRGSKTVSSDMVWTVGAESGFEKGLTDAGRLRQMNERLQKIENRLVGLTNLVESLVARVQGPKGPRDDSPGQSADSEA